MSPLISDSLRFAVFPFDSCNHLSATLVTEPETDVSRLAGGTTLLRDNRITTAGACVSATTFRSNA